MNKCVEISKQSPESWAPELDHLRKSAQYDPLLNDLIGLPAPFIMNRGPRLFRERAAQLRAITTLVAAERFRLATGRWPTELADLVPRYLPAVPTDPYDGKPLRYRKVSDGIVVYAIGAELKDHGGKVQIPPQVPGWKYDLPGMDIGFKLWNPELRHFPPEPVNENPAK